MKQFSRGSLLNAISELTKYSLLQQSDRAHNIIEEKIKTWGTWNPAAGFFHFSTKDIRFKADPVEEQEFLLRKAAESPIPSSIKSYPQASIVELPPPQMEGEFATVLLGRRTWRSFSPEPIMVSELATLLGLSWGIQGWLALPGLGKLPLKTSPSGGARHPVEPYVLALRVKDLPAGIYHYAADRHCLEFLRSNISSREVISLLAGQSWCASAAALIFMTAVFPRTQWKYQLGRAYRVVVADAGHICQTFCLVATWLGLAPFCTMAFEDSGLEKLLGIDGVTESMIYVAGVGSRSAVA
jgi:SagB-type dehydrogenase family enzyme